jgi:rhodanese-related sulfurtransferase
MKKTILILSASLAIILQACNNNPQQNAVLQNADSSIFKSPKTEVSVEEALALSEKGALLIDVREPDELQEMAYDVKEVINIPLGELPNKLKEIPKDKQVIVVCQKGGRSSQAFELLNGKGYVNIANMAGGMDAWSEKGFPTIVAGEKEACCEDPNSKNCNPDGTCKDPAEKKACCENPNSKDCNPDGTCKKPEKKS